MAVWCLVVAASLSWVFAVGECVAPEPIRRWILLGAALLAAVLAFRGESAAHALTFRHLWILAPLAATLPIVPPLYRPPALTLALGVALAALASRGRGPEAAVVRHTGRAAVVLGAVLIAQTPIWWLVAAWTARNPEIPYASGLLYELLAWIGADVGFDGNALYLRTIHDMHQFRPTWGHLALLPLFQIWVGGALLIWWRRARGNVLGRLAAFTATLGAYGVLRLILMLAWFATAMLHVPYGEETVHVELFWLPWVTALSFVPLVPLLARLVPLPEDDSVVEDAPVRLFPRAACIVLAAVAALGAVAGLRYPDPGTVKQGRVLLEEAHSRWERTDTPYDTEWYGGESEYNYYCMAAYLRHFFQVQVNDRAPLTPEMLAAHDVLILKNPTEPYTDAEVDAIDAFVRRGGGLFLVGEHTDVFGTSTCLNQVARRFGCQFLPDAVFDIDRKWEQVFFPPARGAHPIVRDVPFFRYAVTCSIDAQSWRVRPVMRSSGLWSLPIEYAASNFYPQVKDHTYARFGTFDQMVTVPAGRGRVAAFTDSTVYSNFLAFYPGKPELLVKTIAWLDRENRHGWVEGAGLGACALALLGLVVLSAFSRHRLGSSAAALTVAFAAGWGGLWCCDLLSDRWYPMPAPRTPPAEIVFDLQHSQVELPIFGFSQKTEKSYQIFYQWALRPGFFPKAVFDLEAAFAAAAPIIVAKPVGACPPSLRAAARRYLERGGRLLVLDSPGNDAAFANELLGEFGLGLKAGMARGSAIVEPGTGARICTFGRGRSVEGGTPLLATDAGEPVLAVMSVGKGWVAASGLAERFVDAQMGYSTRALPNRELRAVYELAFTLFRGLAQGELPAQVAALGACYATPK